MPFLRGGVHPTVLIRSGKGVREESGTEIEKEKEGTNDAQDIRFAFYVAS